MSIQYFIYYINIPIWYSYYWDKLTESNDSWFERMMYNILDWFQETIFWWLAIGGSILLCGVLIAMDHVNIHKSIEGHTYVKTSMYDWDHSQECWCRTKDKHK